MQVKLEVSSVRVEPGLLEERAMYYVLCHVGSVCLSSICQTHTHFDNTCFIIRLHFCFLFWSSDSCRGCFTLTTLFCLVLGWECGAGWGGNCLICTFSKNSHTFHMKSVSVGKTSCISGSSWFTSELYPWKYQENDSLKAFFLALVDMLRLTSITTVGWFITHLWKKFSYRVVFTDHLVCGWCHCHFCMCLSA